MVRENWFIVTLITHSLGVSSSGVSRGIYHKCKHPLNPTRLYVSWWVESSRVVVYRLKVITCLVVVWILNGENIFDCMMRMLLALAYPVCCMVVLYVAILSCDDHQFNWWEQMGEVPVVSKEMAIPLLSHLGWILYFFPSWISLGLWPMYCFTPCYPFLFC